jgi:hypothetical protein
LAAFAVGHQHDAIRAVLVEKAGCNSTEIVEVAVAERVGERQHLEPSGHALHLGIEHEADAAHGFENALRSIFSVLLVVVENEDRGEHNQRQRGSRDQQSKTNWQGGFPHADSGQWIRRG